MRVLDEQLSSKLCSERVCWIGCKGELTFKWWAQESRSWDWNSQTWVVLSSLSPGANLPPPRTELQRIMLLLFWETALKSAEEKGRDNSININKSKAGIFKMSVDQRCHFSWPRVSKQWLMAWADLLNHKREWIDVWVKQSSLDSFVNPHFYIRVPWKASLYPLFSWAKLP